MLSPDALSREDALQSTARSPSTPKAIASPVGELGVWPNAAGADPAIPPIGSAPSGISFMSNSPADSTRSRGYVYPTYDVDYDQASPAGVLHDGGIVLPEPHTGFTFPSPAPTPPPARSPPSSAAEPPAVKPTLLGPSAKVLNVIFRLLHAIQTFSLPHIVLISLSLAARRVPGSPASSTPHRVIAQWGWTEEASPAEREMSEFQILLEYSTPAARSYMVAVYVLVKACGMFGEGAEEVIFGEDQFCDLVTR